MKLGNKFYLILILYLISIKYLIAEDRISTTPLLNVGEIKPSFEELDEVIENTSSKQKLKEKKNTPSLNLEQAVLIGLDKITAKSSKLVINLNESKKFGPLEIKILKCGGRV